MSLMVNFLPFVLVLTFSEIMQKLLAGASLAVAPSTDRCSNSAFGSHEMCLGNTVQF